jgi:hypothetical protein
MTVAGLGLAACGEDDDTGHLADAPRGPTAVIQATLTAEAACGVAAPPSEDLGVANTGSGALVIMAAEADGGFTVTTALPLTVAPGEQGKLAIRPPASVVGTDRGGAIKSGTLTLTTNEQGSMTRTVALKATVVGANLEFTNADAAPMTLAFTASSAACPAPQAVFLRNTGNQPVTVLGVSSSSAFAFTGFSTGEIAPGGVETQTWRPFSQSGVCMTSSSISFEISGVVCDLPTVQLAATYDLNSVSGCSCT